MPADTPASVWIVTLPSDGRDDRPARNYLSLDELSRADRFEADRDRAAYTFGHAALRLLIERHLGRPLAPSAFARRPSGKPYLAGVPLGFSLSRAGGRAAIGLLDHGEIGVDIEAIAADGLDAITARANFSPHERQWIDSAAEEEERRRRFYRLWVMREALGKASGAGLTGPPDSIALTIESGAPSLTARDGWHAFEAPLVSGYAAAAVVPRHRTVVWFDTTWDALARPGHRLTS